MQSFVYLISEIIVFQDFEIDFWDILYYVLIICKFEINKNWRYNLILKTWLDFSTESLTIFAINIQYHFCTIYIILEILTDF